MRTTAAPATEPRDLSEIHRCSARRLWRRSPVLAERLPLDDAERLLDVGGGWPQQQDVVLLSYLLSCLGDAEIDLTLAKAHECLRPGDRRVVVPAAGLPARRRLVPPVTWAAGSAPQASLP
jgi:hypothetical protein